MHLSTEIQAILFVTFISLLTDLLWHSVWHNLPNKPRKPDAYILKYLTAKNCLVLTGLQLILPQETIRKTIMSWNLIFFVTLSASNEETIPLHETVNDTFRTWALKDQNSMKWSITIIYMYNLTLLNLSHTLNLTIKLLIFNGKI